MEIQRSTFLAGRAFFLSLDASLLFADQQEEEILSSCFLSSIMEIGSNFPFSFPIIIDHANNIPCDAIILELILCFVSSLLLYGN